MKRLADRAKGARIFLVLSVVVVVSLLLYRNELKLLCAPDPPLDKYYEYSFHGVPPRHAERIIHLEGFFEGEQGLQLSPSTSGRIVFAFEKQAHQGCLLRVWFYGDRGKERPNTIKISSDGGSTFQELAGSGNYIGTVFDVSDHLEGCSTFQLAFEAKNHAPFPALVLDGIEVVIGRGAQIKPDLPSLPMLLGLMFLAPLLSLILFSRTLTREEKGVRVVLVIIILLAAYLRWNEVVRLSGTILDEDARGYYSYAQKMSLFSEHGFYSAHFEKREPLFILVARVFFAFSGPSTTHLRFVSLVFSLLTVFLTYRIGKEWFHAIAGLTAAFILAVHPYLIQLSARGLREEWFTVLVLLFVYYGYVKADMGSRLRAVASGFLAGCILLTRSECLPLIAVLLLLYPLFARTKWNYAMALIALILAIALFLPHQYSLYKKYGDPFYTANQYARFYANREFAGKPSFPSRKEIMEQGMYAGPKLTPFTFYFSLHTPWQLISYNLLGFAKIQLKMPFAFIAGRGNAAAVLYSIESVRMDPHMGEVLSFLKLAGSLLRDRWWATVMGFSVMLTFLGGLVLIGIYRHWLVYLYLIVFQMHTSFLAYLGLDERLSIHSYPLIALCCGFCLYELLPVWGRKKSPRFGPLLSMVQQWR